MKAEIEQGERHATVKLTPEGDLDRKAIMEFAKWMNARGHIINCRGFGYMDPTVEFLVQPTPTGD